MTLAFTSCNDKTERDSEIANVMLFNYMTDSKDPMETVDVYALNSGVLASKYININATTDGYYPIDNIEDRKNTVLLFLTNGQGINMDPLVIGETSNTDMQSKTTPAADYKLSQPIHFYTGEKSLSDVSELLTNVMVTRSLARLDLKIQPEINVKIDSCVITNITDRSQIFPSQSLSHPDAKLISTSIGGSNFTATTTETQEGFFYLYESHGAGSEVMFFIKLNGVANRLKVALPDRVERNKKYTITINSHGATLSSSLEVLPWGPGSDADANPEPFQPIINTEESEIPALVEVSATKDTIFVPSIGASLTLALNTSTDTEIKTDGDILIEPIDPATKSTYIGNKFNLSLKSKNINDPRTETRIYIKDKTISDIFDRYIVVVNLADRTSFPNIQKAAIINERSVVFNGYTDGIIANIKFSTQPISIACTTNDVDFNWLRINNTDDNDIKLEGAFKPNDSMATGQIQESTVTIEYSGGLIEEFKFSRKRESIPVTFIGNRYWAKYNLRGNSKKYEDQIGFDKDIKGDMFEYLKTCSDDEYIYYAGANYKGISQDGMYLAKLTDNTLHYPDYSKHLNAAITNLDPTYHCPAGYQIPNVNEFASIMSKSSHINLPGNDIVWEYSSSGRIRLTIERHQRDSIKIDGVNTIKMYTVKIVDKLTKETLTWHGTGNQWSNTGTSIQYWIYATINPGGKYYTFNNLSNKTQFEPHNSAKTRIIRCIKSPVTYVI